MANGMVNEDIYNAYFGRKPAEVKRPAPEPIHPENTVYTDKKSARVHLEESVKDHNGYSPLAVQRMADENIDGIEQLSDILKRLCNAAWGEGWGELSPDIKYGEDPSNVLLPQITVEVNTRDPAEGMSLKPVLTDIVDEVDAEGTPTGDGFLIYRQWFDCNVEFNFYGRNNKEARQLQRKFETLLSVYTGYLKRNGISEIAFGRETSPKTSLNYIENIPMRCIYYYIRLETITPIRQSLINSINIEIGAGQITSDKVKTVIEENKMKAVTELDFFDGDTGITYNLD